ncbi:MAG: hypothetical protein AB8I08_03820 [Sandaracinaceae bacterium]
MREEAAPPRSEEPAPRKTGVWIAALGFVYLVLSFVPAPGVSGEALQTTVDTGLLSFLNLTPAVRLLSAGVLLIVPVHLLLMLAGRLDRAPLRVAAAAVCLLAVALEALSHAFILESMNSVSIGDVVSNPGWGFRLMLLVSRLAAASVVLFVLGGIDRTRGASGALVLNVFHALSVAVGGAYFAGERVVDGQTSVLEGLLILLTPLSVFVVVLALLLRPQRWPVKLVGQVALRGGWDAAGVVTLASLPVAMLGSAMAAVSNTSVGLATLGAVFQALFTAGVLFLLFRRQAEAGRRPWGLFAVSAVSVLAAVPLWGAGLLSSSSGLERLMSGGPLEGEASFVLVLGAEDAFVEGDGEAMVERLESLGAEADVVLESPEQIRLAVTSTDPQSVVGLLQPRELSFHFAMSFPENPYEGDARLDPVIAFMLREDPPRQVRAWDASCDVATEHMATPPPGACVWRLERGDVEGECTLHCVESAPVLVNADVAEVSLRVDPYSQMPVVALVLAPDASARFGEATAARVQGVLAMVVDGEVLSAPMVQAPVTGGHVQITMGGYRSYEELLQEAESVAGSLGQDGISWGRFVLLEVR